MAHPLAPPGDTTSFRAERALVIAPHADDEVLGCGGLVAQLAAGGCRVEVLFLTDSSGGEEGADDPAGYRMTRQQEAQRGLAVLGVTGCRWVGLPDGRLAQHIDDAAAAIAHVLLELRPQLILSVGPTEITDDHQAAFAALHRVLHPLRGGADLDQAVSGSRILLYEVNHPAFPDRLVDITAELDRLSKAIRCHRSQLERHDYLGAALGARRWRTLSLGPEVGAAEGYRELTPADFGTRSLAGLTEHLGGRPRLQVVDEGPVVSVVVRTRDREELLAEALSSLAAQTWRRTEVVLVNDGGRPPEVPDGFGLPLVRVEHSESQGRAAAANAGIQAASGDWIAFLDDDDLAEPEHLETLVGIARAPGVRVAYTDAAVGVYAVDGDRGWTLVDRRLPYSRDFDPDLLLVDNYIPFNTVLVERRLLTTVGDLDPELPFFEDWDLLLRLARHTPFHHLARVTCEYRHFRSGGHHVFGEHPAARSDFLSVKAQVIERHRDRLGPESLARVAQRLRDESVGHAEDAATARAELADLRDRHAALTDRWHRLNGEREGLARHLEAMTADRDAHRHHAAELTAEIERLAAEEAALRSHVAEQDAHLARTYAEIERLGGVISAMESTRAWRWHQRLQRVLGRGS